MHSPGHRLTRRVCFLSLMLLLHFTGMAQAHRLMAEFHVLRDQRIQIESWFDITGESPQNASVQVFGSNGGLLHEGKLDAKGVFVFELKKREPCSVIVAAGAGHSKELQIGLADLEISPSRASEVAQPTVDDQDEIRPLSDRSSRVSMKDALVGIGFVLALAAFVLSIRNARAIRELRRLDDIKNINCPEPHRGD